MANEQSASATAATEVLHVDLRQPGVAAIWAWLWPGAGHIYQGRYAKGILYMVCILGTWFFGLGMGNGHVVYASFDWPDNFRWHYVLQLGVGLPAAPAIVQAVRVNNHREPLLVDFMAPPGPVDPERFDTLARWHGESHMFFELGTLYTVVAGLLNILAIYDAYAGPVIGHPDDDKRPPPDKNKEPAKT
jgi:hypothetical protein